MKIEISKREDNTILLNYDGKTKNLIYENLLELAKTMLDKKMAGEDTSFEVVAIDNPGELSLYVEATKDILDGVLKDAELYEVYCDYKKKNKEDNAE